MLKQLRTFIPINMMEKELLIIKTELTRLISQIDNQEWETSEITIEAPPFTNKGFNMTSLFKDIDGNKIRLILRLDYAFQQSILGQIVSMNQVNEINKILYYTKRNDYENASVNMSFDQAIEDNFQNNLPKSKRGKTIPWYKV